MKRSILICLGTLLVAVGVVAGVVNREVLDADRFASHVDAVRSDPDVARQVAVLLTDRLLEQQPDLVAVRPLIESTAASVVASPALGPVVRTAVAPLYDALVLGDSDAVVLRLADVAAVVIGIVAAAAPEVNATIPADLDVLLSDFGGHEYSPHAIDSAHLVQILSWLGPLLGLLVLAGSARFRVRAAARATGVGVTAAGLVVAGLLVVAGVLAGRGDTGTLDGAVRNAVWGELVGAFWVAAALTVALGGLLTVAAGISSRPQLSLERVRAFFDPAAGLLTLTAHAAVVVALGVALVLQPVRVVTAALVAVGAVLIIVGAGSLLVALVRGLDHRRTWGIGAAVALVVGIVVVALPSDHDLAAAGPTPGAACNGHVELCDRAYDEVAYPATHNSMAAASEGWFFPEQPDGIVDQLDHGVRALLIDSWYGRGTDRAGVIANTDEDRAAAVAEARQSFGDAAVASALRLRNAVGLTPRGPVGVYLCHGLCELGATPWLESLREVRTWLDAHPREVVTLFVQDQVSPADTAELIEQAGLLPSVYTPADDGDWPTLGAMIASGKRLVVLMENEGGGTAYPWLLPGFEQSQDTPFLFRRPAQLGSPGSCAANRGNPDASLFLLNHWITDKSAEVTNAERVNASDVLLTRARECEGERGLLPNYVAVDFYDRGDLFDVVDELNGL
ncbi:hypothetical protein GCM10023350_43950 [Nocardioides endophyticus]|uniref:Uncharacterized protein n=1 Tax=Nocardioides endophyticus TaxID=1353775 RepID=A0ABP8ZE21_9ACTN